MPQNAAGIDEVPAPSSAAEAVQQLSQHAESLIERLHQLLSSHRESSSKQAAITTEHIAIYDEAAQMLEVMACSADS